MTRLMIKKQSGAALVVGLIILLVMTLLGVTSMNSSRTELKISANMQNHNLAFQTAEAGISQVLTSKAPDWTDVTSINTFSYVKTGSKFSAVTTKKFADCRNNPIGYSLDGDGANDGSGGSNKAIIHSLTSLGQVKSGTTVAANSTIEVGVATVLAGCSPPVSTP